MKKEPKEPEKFQRLYVLELETWCCQDYFSQSFRLVCLSPTAHRISFKLWGRWQVWVLNPYFSSSLIPVENFSSVIEISEERFCSSFSHMLTSESIIIARILCQGAPRLILPEARVMGYCDWQHGIGEESKGAQFLHSRDWTFWLSYLCQSIRGLWVI